MVSARARRLQVGYARNRGISARRACALLAVSRSTLGYCSRMVAKDEPVRAAMQELSGQYPRFGYRRIQVFLERRGLPMSADRAYRIWSAAGLQVPKKRPRRRIACSRPRPVPATAENRVWAYDFVFDACANGQQLKCLTVIDEYTRECLAIDVAGGIRSSRVIRSLEQIMQWRGTPKVLRCDNGPEYISESIINWAKKKGIRMEYIQPGKPQQNAYVERFNRTVRYEWLAQYCFDVISEVQDFATRWIWNYNHERPNMALGGITPKQRLAMAA